MLRDVVAGKLERPVAGLSREELNAVLLRAGMTEELVERFTAELEDCDRARFAPGNVDAEHMRQTLERAEEIIVQIEKARLRPEEVTA